MQDTQVDNKDNKLQAAKQLAQNQSACTQFWYVISCQWCYQQIQTKIPEKPIVWQPNMEQSNKPAQSIPQLSIEQLTEQLASEKYQDKQRLIKQIQRVTKEHQKHINQKVLILYYEIAKFYLFYSEYSESLKYLALILIENSRLQDYNISETQLKMFKFVCLCHRAMENNQDYQKQLIYLKKQYLELVRLIYDEKQSKRMRFQQILFASSLIFYLFQLGGKIALLKETIQLDFISKTFFQQIIENDGLKLVITKQKDKVVTIPSAQQVDKEGQHLTTESTQVAQQMIKVDINQGQTKQNLTNLQQPSLPCNQSHSHQMTKLFGQNYVKIFQQQVYKKKAQNDEIPQKERKQVEHVELSRFWNLNAVFIGIMKNQSCWLKIFKSKKNFQLPQVKEKETFKNGMGILLKIQPDHSQRQKQTVNQANIQKLYQILGFNNNNTQNQKDFKICQLQYIKIEPSMPDYKQKIQKQINRAVPNNFLQRKKQEPGLDVGLNNLGNTCYMNSALQCLHKSRHFTENFSWLADKIKQKFANKRTYELTELFKTFIQQMWKSKQPLSAWQIKEVMGEKNYLFKHYDQSDATQFFLTFILIISQELNNPTEKQQKEIDHYREDSKSIYEKIKFNDETYCKSIIEDTFTGRYRVEYTSKLPFCKHRYILFEKFNVHYVDIPPAKQGNRFKQSLTLQQCLNYSSQPDTLRPQDRMTCDICHKSTFDIKNMQIYEAGKILVFSFKRFLDGRKNDAQIKVPEYLQPNEVIVGGDLQSYKGLRYKLYGAIIHYGNLKGGHYIAVCYNYRSNKWMQQNDQNASQTTQKFQQIDFNKAMTIFYEIVQDDSQMPKIQTKQGFYRNQTKQSANSQRL